MFGQEKSTEATPITSLTKKEVIPSVFIFFFSVIIVYLVYIYFIGGTHTLYTLIIYNCDFLVACQWQIEKLKVGFDISEVISVPLYLYKY